MASPAASSRSPAASRLAFSPKPRDTGPHNLEALNGLKRLVQPCFHFARDRCRNGDRCSFEHIAAERTAATATSRANMEGPWRRLGSAQTASEKRSGQVRSMERSPQISTVNKFESLSNGDGKDSSSSSSSSSGSYVAASLRPAAGGQCRAVDVVAYRRNGDTFELLFCRSAEQPKGVLFENIDLSLVGGLANSQKVQAETAANAVFRTDRGKLALRCGFQGAAEVQQQLQSKPVMWDSGAVFLLQLPDTTTEPSGEEKPNHSAAASASAATPPDQSNDVRWIELATLLRYLDSSWQRDRTVEAQCDHEVRTTSTAATMTSATVCTLRRPLVLAELDRLLRSSSLKGACAFKVIRAERRKRVPKRSRGSVNAAENEPGYVERALKPQDAPKFKAAGVFAYREIAGRVQVLMGRQNATHDAQRAGMLAFLSGKKSKKNQGETPQQTAAREAWEESAELLDKQSLLERTQSSHVLWQPYCRYALFFVELSGEKETAICESYAEARSRWTADVAVRQSQTAADDDDDLPRDREEPLFWEMESLHWIDLEVLQNFLNEPTQSAREFKHICDERVATADGEKYPVDSFAVRLMNEPRMREWMERLQPAPATAPAAGSPAAPPAASPAASPAAVPPAAPAAATPAASPAVKSAKYERGDFAKRRQEDEALKRFDQAVGGTLTATPSA